MPHHLPVRICINALHDLSLVDSGRCMCSFVVNATLSSKTVMNIKSEEGAIYMFCSFASKASNFKLTVGEKLLNT